MNHVVLVDEIEQNLRIGLFILVIISYSGQILTLRNYHDYRIAQIQIIETIREFISFFREQELTYL